MVEIVTATYRQDVLEKNLGASPGILQDWFPNVKYMRNGNNVAREYNHAETTAEIVCYVHEDVFLPHSFICDLLNSLTTINKIDNNFGVLGVAGVVLENGKKKGYGYLEDRGRIWGSPENLPHEVQTLDEVLLITHGDFTFDENLPTDFYGADICMQAIQQGRKNYAINAFVHHNSTRLIGARTESFYKCEKYFREKYKHMLPIATTCSILT